MVTRDIDGRPGNGSIDSPLFGLSQRLPPSNIQAEQALLGAILSNNRAYERVSAFLAADHFADPIHARIYQSIVRKIEAGQLADAVTLKAEFENAGVLQEVGGTAYLTQLLTAMVGILQAGDYGRAILDCWTRRREIEIGEGLIAGAYGSDPDRNGMDVLGQAEDEIAALRGQITAITAAKGGTVTAFDAFCEAVDRARSIGRGEIPGAISTGLPAIDRMLGGGISPDNLIYMIGAGGSGKTEMALQIAESVAAEALRIWRAGGSEGICPGVLYIMLGNMTARQLGARTAARAAAMRLGPIRRGTIDMEQGERLAMAGRTVLELPLEISDDGPSTIARVLGDMRRVAKRRPLVLTIVDNFSDMLSLAPDKMFGTAIGITKSLKELGATATGSTVMLLMHLNSAAESGSKRTARPGPADIPWGTKKDADAAFGVWRPAKYLDPNPPERPAKKLSAEGEEMYLKWKTEWEDKRQPWPVGIADITEVVPMKLREEEDKADKVSRLKFDRDVHRFIDVDGNGGSPATD